jgi:hypothetical protein
MNFNDILQTIIYKTVSILQTWIGSFLEPQISMMAKCWISFSAVTTIWYAMINQNAFVVHPNQQSLGKIDMYNSQYVKAMDTGVINKPRDETSWLWSESRCQAIPKMKCQWLTENLFKESILVSFFILICRCGEVAVCI